MRINKTVVLEHLDGDLQLLAELALMFLEDYPRLIDEMRHSIAKDDSDLVERTAHSLKGRLAFFGMDQERELALKLEVSGRQDKLAEARCLLVELEEKIKARMPEFAALTDNADGAS